MRSDALATGALRDDVEPDVAATLILGSLAPWSAKARADARAAAVTAPFLASGARVASGETRS